MPLHNKQDFLNEVCQNIRWKKSHSIIKKELTAHIDDQKDAFMANGNSAEQATEMAIKQMGDPCEIGIGLDRVYRPKPSYGFFALVFAMIIFTAALRIMLVGIAPQDIVLMSVGVIVLFAAYFFDYTLIYKYCVPIYIGLVFVPILLQLFVTTKINGVNEYVMLGGTAFNINYFALLVPVLYACLIYKMPKGGFKEIFCMGIFAVLPLASALLSPNLTVVIMVAVSCLTVLCLAIHQKIFTSLKRRILYPIVFSPFVIFGIIFLPRMFEVVEYNPQLLEMRNTILPGCKFIGASSMLDEIEFIGGYMPDFILTKLILEYGYIVAIILAVLVLAVVVYGIVLIARQSSRLSKLICVGILSIFVLQCVTFMCSNLGFFYPFKGFRMPSPFPFLQGSQSMLFNMILMGVFLSVVRNDAISQDHIVSNSEKRKFFQVKDGQVIISFR